MACQRKEAERKCVCEIKAWTGEDVQYFTESSKAECNNTINCDMELFTQYKITQVLKAVSVSVSFFWHLFV